MKATAIDDALTAIVAELDGVLEYPVFDGPPSKMPDRTVDRWLAVGANDVNDLSNPADSATMEAQITGLGMVAREESLHIECVAIGKSETIAAARGIAMAVVEDTSQHLGKYPGNTYGAHISNVSAVRSHNVAGGAIVQVQFTITASARLT